MKTYKSKTLATCITLALWNPLQAMPTDGTDHEAALGKKHCFGLGIGDVFSISGERHISEKISMMNIGKDLAKYFFSGIQKKNISDQERNRLENLHHRCQEGLI